MGVPLEMVHRWWRLLLLYVAGVLAGSLAASMFDPKVSLCFLGLFFFLSWFLFILYILDAMVSQSVLPWSFPLMFNMFLFISFLLFTSMG